MKIHNLLAISVIFIILLFGGLASSKTTAWIVESKWDYMLCLILCVIWGIAGAIAVLVISLNGLKYMSTEDPGEKNEVKTRLMHVIIALCIILIAMPLVNYLVENTDVVGFECDCIGGIPARMVVRIDEPGHGWICNEGELITFSASVFGGKPPYEYRWTSSVDGDLRSSKSFRKILSVGTHIIRLEVTDSRGVSASDEIRMESV